jgi:nitrite reductase (NADH) large subunit
LTETRRTLVVVGNGMVGHRLVELVVERGLTDTWDVVVFGEEARPAYDRVGLSSFFAGKSAEELSLVSEGFYDRPGLTLQLGDPVTAINTEAMTVHSAAGRFQPYDALVLATGSSAFVPRIPGNHAIGCFEYRTIDDLEAMRGYADELKTRIGGRTPVGVVIGGGLLGLEAANALRNLGLKTHVVELAPRLMPLQVDDGGGEVLRTRVEGLGVSVHAGRRTRRFEADEAGRVQRIVFAEGNEELPLDVDMVVFSTGIAPRDEIATAAGIAVAERGGIVVDERCRTNVPDVYAVGECALACGRVWGLVAPGYAMAEAVVAQLAGGDGTFTGFDQATKLKLLGVDVASFGDAFAKSAGALGLVYWNPLAGVYRKLVVTDDAKRVLGGILVGDADDFGTLRQMAAAQMEIPQGKPDALLVPAAEAGAERPGPGALPDSATICSCLNVSKGAICAAVAEGYHDIGGVKQATKAGTRCGSCVPLIKSLIADELAKAGVAASKALCEHFDVSRQDLFDIIRVLKIGSFSDLISLYGRGRGCDVCKPVVANILATQVPGHVLAPGRAGLQDTNDRYLANMQKDGTYSVVPRIPAGEITPEGLMAIAEVARDFGLYTKITGAQRIDMFGARLEQLPRIWRRLVDAGFESGHAYGKSLRTVKSCVGSVWCRYGVGDAVRLAIELELRYRGLRSPHKLKMAVSGCARECAEAQSKDVGVIATDKGWNMYVCGNGGMTPRHADLFATDLDTETLLRYIDRFLMYYIHTADPLQRTARWMESHEGGLDHLRSVIIDDSLGLCDELDREMAEHIAHYEDEWAAVLNDPDRLTRFASFVNAPGRPDPGIVFRTERGQIRPATPEEVAARQPVSLGTTIPSRDRVPTA